MSYCNTVIWISDSFRSCLDFHVCLFSLRWGPPARTLFKDKEEILKSRWKAFIGRNLRKNSSRIINLFQKVNKREFCAVDLPYKNGVGIHWPSISYNKYFSKVWKKGCGCVAEVPYKQWRDTFYLIVNLSLLVLHVNMYVYVCMCPKTGPPKSLHMVSYFTLLLLLALCVCACERVIVYVCVCPTIDLAKSLHVIPNFTPSYCCSCVWEREGLQTGPANSLHVISNSLSSWDASYKYATWQKTAKM